MSEAKVTVKVKQRVLDRVSLNEVAIRRVDELIQTVESRNRGVTLSRRDLVNWIIETHPTSLSAQQEKDLAGKFYNEVRFLQQALKDLKAAKARGETVSLDALLSSDRVVRKEKRPRNKKAKPEGPINASNEASKLDLDHTEIDPRST